MQKAHGAQVHEIYKVLKEIFANEEGQPSLITAATDSDEDATNGDQKKAPGVAKDAYTGNSLAKQGLRPDLTTGPTVGRQSAKGPRFVQWVADRRTTPLIAPFQLRLQFMKRDVECIRRFLITGENSGTGPDGYPEATKNYMWRTVLPELISMYPVCRLLTCGRQPCHDPWKEGRRPT